MNRTARFQQRCEIVADPRLVCLSNIAHLKTLVLGRFAAQLAMHEPQRIRQRDHRCWKRLLYTRCSPVRFRSIRSRLKPLITFHHFTTGNSQLGQPGHLLLIPFFLFL
jgi:hypothetical protein